jgi:hypothetical protein
MGRRDIIVHEIETTEAADKKTSVGKFEQFLKVTLLKGGTTIDWVAPSEGVTVAKEGCVRGGLEEHAGPLGGDL